MKYLVKRCNRKFPEQWRSKPPVARAFSSLLNLCVLNDLDFRRGLTDAVEHCCNQAQADPVSVRRDMMYEYVRKWVLPAEFVRFGFLNKNTEERGRFMAEYEGVLVFKITSFNTLPNNKYERYRMFAPYFHREILHVYAQATPPEREKYVEFVSRNPEFVVKTIRGTKGQGVRKFTAQEAPDMDSLLAQMGKECIVEAMINQGQALAAFHPQSVNTVRYVTAIDGSGRIFPMFSLLRVGRGNSIVDNVGSGGMVALIDMDSGTVCTDGLCGMDYQEVHPDTHVCFKGTKIPEWDRLRSMAYEMHASQPGQRLYGFDFAWTDKGWDIVEVNPAPSFASYQALSHRGIRPLLIEKGMIK